MNSPLDFSEAKVYTFYPWSMSSTKKYDKESLTCLRDQSVQALVMMLWDAGPQTHTSATAEFLSHGNPRKAAEFVRALASQHPEEKLNIRRQYEDRGWTGYLFDTPLSSLPRSPREYPRDALIGFIQ